GHASARSQPRTFDTTVAVSRCQPLPERAAWHFLLFFTCNILPRWLICTKYHLTIEVENPRLARVFLAEESSHAATSSRPAAAGPADREGCGPSPVDRRADAASPRPGRRRTGADPHHAQDRPLARRRHCPLPQRPAARGTGFLKTRRRNLVRLLVTFSAMNAR